MIKLRLEILFQLMIFFVRILVVYLLVMGGSQVIFIFKDVLSRMMPLLFWFGLKIKFL